MATKEQIARTYDYMDEIFRLTYGPHGDISNAYFNGDFRKSLAQAQRDKHEYILQGINFRPGARVLDVGCGWGPMLNAVRSRGGVGVGLTLSPRQAAACRQAGLDVRLADWKAITPESLGRFDAVVSLGAFEHFCSVEEFLAGKQEQIYAAFFQFVYELLPDGGRLYLQTMCEGKNMPPFERVSVHARRGSNEYVLAMVGKFYPGSWIPSSPDRLVEIARPWFDVISSSNGRLDYIETMKRWGVQNRRLSPRKAVAIAKLLPRYLTDHEFRYQIASLRGGYNRVCFEREIFDHIRIFFQKRPAQD